MQASVAAHRAAHPHFHRTCAVVTLLARKQQCPRHRMPVGCTDRQPTRGRADSCCTKAAGKEERAAAAVIKRRRLLLLLLLLKPSRDP
jgi:hypothetical protein